MPRNSERILTEWLVLNAQSGKVDAMDQLLRIWYPKFLAYSTRQLSDREAAKDVVQETLLVIARTISRLKDPVAFPRWAYQILHRRGVDYLRKAIRQRKREVQDPNMDSTPGTAAADNESVQSVYNALNHLGELSYNIIHLRYLHGLSVKEITRVCSIPEGTVKSRLHTARKQLRTLLEENL